jgi:hypothetical protein
MSNLTQEDLILSELKRVGSDGLHPTYIIETLHIFQYNARVNGLRKRFNCNCKNGKHCFSDEHIINKRLPDKTTKFFYENTTKDWEKERQEAVKKMKEEPVISSDQLSMI